MTTRLDKRFARLKAESRAAFVTFITAGDPDFDKTLAILTGLPAAGADVIELGMPFTDPMADGPAIQASTQRALKAGASMKNTLELVRRFRAGDADTPIVLMGYYNPIYHMGVDMFLSRAKEAGVDGLIVVDLPPEEDDELCEPAMRAGLNFIRLATPTTDDRRLPTVLKNTAGFVYYVSIMGITGTAPLGSLIQGWTADVVGPRETVVTSGALFVLLAFVLQGTGRVRHLDDEGTPTVVDTAAAPPVDTVAAPPVDGAAGTSVPR